MKGKLNLTGMRLLWVMAVTTLVLGVGLTINSIRITPEYSRWISRKMDDLAQLENMYRSLETYRRAAAAFCELEDRKPVELSDTIRRIMPGVSSDIRQRETRPAAKDWTVMRMEVELDEAPLEGLGEFLYYVESSRPPWRLVECNLVASDRGPGYARATLILEGLEKR